MTEVPNEFKQFVNCLENNITFKELKFKSYKELQVCMKYFFEQAVTKPYLSHRFASIADKLKKIHPPNEKPGNGKNLKNALLNETKIQVDEIAGMLKCATSVNKDRAKGIYIFFGELFNVGIVFIGPLRAAVELLNDSKHESGISRECLSLLLQNVKAKFLGMPDDYSGDYRYLMEVLKNPEFDRSSKETPAKAPQINLMKTSIQFPDLGGSSWSLDGFFSKELSSDEKVETFKAILSKLTTDNCVDVIRKIEAQNKSIFDNDSWQSYYDVLVSEALSKPSVINSIIIICEKLPKLGNAWNAVKKEDYQKYIFSIIANEIEAGSTQTKENAIVNLFKTLVNKSLCSIGSIASVLVSTIKYSDTNIAAAANILCKIVEIIRWKFNETKIQKLLEETRRKVVEIIRTKQLNEEKFALIRKYFLGEENLATEQHEQGETDTEDNKVVDYMSEDSSARSNCVPSTSGISLKKPTFNIEQFFKKAETKDYEVLRQLVQTSIKQQGWNLNQVAKKLLESAFDGSNKDINFLKFVIFINTEAVGENFDKKLPKAVISHFHVGLMLESSQKNFNDLSSTARFLSELYNIGWINGQEMLDCINLIASEDFITYEKTKILKYLIKPAITRLRSECFVDRFTFYFQLLRKGTNESKTLEHREVYLELIDLMKSLSAVGDIDDLKEQNAPAMKSLFTSKEKQQIELLVDETTKGNFDSNLTVLSFIISNHPEKTDFLANHIVSKALTDHKFIVLYVAMVNRLKETENSRAINNYILNACSRVLKNAVFDNGRITDETFKWMPKFLDFACELYKGKVLEDKFIASCLKYFFDADEGCEKSVQCIVQVMTSIGATFEKENLKTTEKYFHYFEWLVSSPENDFRSFEFRKLIKFRKNGWKVQKNEAEKVVSIDLSEPKLHEIKTIKNQFTTLTINFDVLKNDECLDAAIADIKRVLTTEIHVKTFIQAALNRHSTDPMDILLQTKLLRNLSKSFSDDSESQINFSEFLVEAMNSELVRTSAFRTFDEHSKIVFTRLLVMSVEFYNENLLPGDDFAPWLLHKHVSQVSVEHLCQLCQSVLPKIQNEGNKHLKLALNILETSIHTATIEMSASIKNDICELGRELQFHRIKALNARTPHVHMAPLATNWYVGQPLGFMRGANTP